jgi:hypothetical protein
MAEEECVRRIMQTPKQLFNAARKTSSGLLRAVQVAAFRLFDNHYFPAALLNLH